MKLYLDGADHGTWTLPAGAPPVQGVTTNPTLVRQAGLRVALADYLGLIARAGEARLPELMLQLPQPDVAQGQDWIVRLAPAAAQAGVALTIKLPCHPDWAALAAATRAAGLPVLITGVANPVQLLWAQAQGARWVAPYFSRLVADGRDAWALMQACVALPAGAPQLLAASVKTADDLARLIGIGAQAVTLRPDMVASLCQDRLTQAAIDQFNADCAG